MRRVAKGLAWVGALAGLLGVSCWLGTWVWLGQVRKVDGLGVLRLDDPVVRARIVDDDRALLDAGFDGIHYDIEPRADQVAVMTYDTNMPAEALAGRDFARQTERVLRLVGDRVTVFMGVPTYRPATSWAESLPVALRGVRKGLDGLGRRPSRAYGVAVYADWTTGRAEWGVFRREWLG